MEWWKAIVIGFVIYGVVYVGGAVICVGGLGYSAPDVCNGFASVMTLGLGSIDSLPTPVMIIVSTVFWALIFALIIKKTRR